MYFYNHLSTNYYEKNILLEMRGITGFTLCPVACCDRINTITLSFNCGAIGSAIFVSRASTFKLSLCKA